MRRLITLVLFAALFLSFHPKTASAAISESNPSAIAVNEVTNTVYLANYSSPSVKVVNGATGATITTLTVASPPRAVAVNPVTNRIYVANVGGTVTVINGATNTITTNVTVGSTPYAVAVDPVNNKVYVANSGSGTVSVIDGTSNTVTNTVTVGTSPEAVAVNIYTHTIFVANYGSSSVSVIAGSNYAVTPVSVGPNPIALAVNPVTNTIYVANNGTGTGGNSVSVISGATNAVTTVGVGTNPYAVAVNPVTDTIYVVNNNANTGGTVGSVSVINGTSNTVSSTVTVGYLPTAVAVNPVTNAIYVTNNGNTSGNSGTLSIINGATNTATTVAAGNQPYEVAVDPVTNKIYVGGPNAVTTIDGATNATATVTAGTSPIAVAVNPVTDTIYVGDNSSNDVTVIAGATNATTTVPAGTGPHSVAVNPVTNTIYVADQTSNNVTVINGATNAPTTVTDPLATTPYAVAVNPVTNTIYVANQGSNNVSVINGVTSTVTTTISVGTGPNAVAVNPVTNTIYVTNGGSGNVSVINGATNTVTTAVGVGTTPNAVAVNPVTNTIYVANNGSGNMSVIAGATNTITTTVTVQSAPIAVAVNQVSNTIYVANYTSGTVSVINGATNAVSATLTAGTNPTAVAVNPVSNKIYVANHGSSNVTVINGATTANTVLTTITAGTNPTAVAVNPETNQIYVANNGSSNVTVITEQQVQPIPLSATIAPLPTGIVSYTATPVFNFTASSNWSPYLISPPPTNLYYQVDSWQNAWTAATNEGSGNFTATSATLQPGLHILYAFSTDGQDADSSMANLQQDKVISDIVASPFYYGVSPPSDTIAPNPVPFGNQNVNTTSAQQAVTITNNSGGPLTISNIQTSTDYSIASNNCPAALNAGMSCTVGLTFTPSITGSDNGTLTVTDDNLGVAGTQQTVTLTGTGIASSPALTIAASSTSMTYGGTAPTPTPLYTYGTYTNTSTAPPGMTTLPTCVTSASSSTPAGTDTGANTCSGAVDPSYTIQPYVAGNVTVNPAPLTITANNDSKTYGQTKTYGAGSTAFTSSGLITANGDSITSVTLTSTGAPATATYTAPGPTYSIVPSGAVGTGLSNYTINYVNGTLTVNQAPLSITANSTSKTYGQTVTFAGTEFTTSGTLYNGDSVTSATLFSMGAAAAATVISPGPTYPIVPSNAAGSGVGNYTLSYVNGTLTVNALPVTASIAANNKFYDGTNTTTITTCSIPSAVNGDNVGCSASNGQFASANASASPQTVTATVSLTGSTAGNYTLSSTTASTTATISPAPASVTPNATTKVYGTADPTFTGTLAGFLAGDGVSATYSRTAGQTVASYTISAVLSATGLLSNYNITYNTAQFTITPASLTITASSSTSAYGAAIPTPTASYSGFVNGDTSASLSPGPTCATTGVPVGNPAGTYSSGNTCSGAVDGNYNITYVAGTVIISQASPTVAAVGGTFAYNGNSEAASATALGIGNVTVSGSFAFTYTGTGSTTYGPSSTPPTSVGTYSVAVLFTSTNPNYTNGSASTTIQITPATAGVVVASSDNPSTFGASVTFTATVSSAAGTPTGTVQFVVDGANFGSPVALSSGTATSPTTTTLTAGEHVVTAVYSGDANFQGSTSLFLIQVVNNPLASIAVTPANPTIFVSGTQPFAASGTFADSTSAILPTGGTWAVENTMTNAVRAPMAAAGSNGLLYYFGGQDGSGAENFVQTLNPATGAWASGASMTTARYQGVAVAPGNGLIYVIGGWNNSTPTSVVEAYDPVGNAWTSEASMSHLSGCSQGGAINGLIYVLTGCDGNAGFSKEFDVYNPVTNTWTSLGSPAHAHNSGAGGVIGGKFYVAGGYDVSTATGITEVYDPQTSTWSTVSSMPAQLGELGGAVFSGNLYVAGGLDNSSNPQPDVYAYTPQSDTWSTLSSTLSAGRRDIGVAAFDGLLYAAGGYTASNSNALEVLDTDDVTWASDTTSVATVDPNSGLATGATPGTANITASSTVYSPVSGSTLLTVTKQNQTITFGPLANVTYGAAPFSISATDSASLPVTFTSTTTPVCTVSGGTLSGNATSASVTILAAGTCSITASQAGNTSYNAATSVTQSFTVNPAALTITASSGSFTYGGTPPTITPSYSGFVNGDSAASLTTLPTCSTTATSASHVSGNPYTSTCSGASDSNYTITYTTGSVTVNAAPLTVTASSGSFTYGGTPPTITGSGSGFVNGDTIASLVGLSCSTTATNASHVSGNPYTSTCSGGSDSDYSITYAHGTVNVNPAPLTVTASSGSFTYGGTPPTITASGSGFVNGDTISSLGAGLSCSTTATSASHVSGNPYPSTCAGASDSDYTITYASGSVNVNPAPLTVTASSGSFTYGGTPPTITGSGSGFVNGDTIASLVGLGCSTTATSASHVSGNPYPSTCSGASDSDYSITYAHGTVTVNAAPLTITASNSSFTYGGTPPTITASGSGFVNGDTIASLAGLSCSTTATSASHVSGNPYTSTCSGASDSDYAMSFVNGTVTVNPAPLTITASNGSFTYGGTPPSITASYSGFVNGDSSASLTTAPTCSTTATNTSPVSGSPYQSTCTGAVDSNYNISYVKGSVTENAAVLTITASSPSMTYGGTVPAVTAGYSGFVNGDSAASLSPAPTCSAPGVTSGSPVGSYPTSCTGAVDNNYSISYVAGSLTIGKAALTITASSGSFTYGGTVPTITAGYSGFVGGDTSASLTTQPTCSTTATSTSPVSGSPYQSTCSGAVDGNYNISYVAGSVTVNPALLTIIASSSSMTYGGTVPTITANYTYGSVVNSATPPSGLTPPTCATAATSSSPVGAYSSSCSGASDANYTIIYTPGTITVNQAALTITASSSSMTYGGTVPTVTASYTYGSVVNSATPPSGLTPPTCTTTATSSTPVGTDTGADTCSGAVDNNYAITYVAGNVTVGTANLNITASSGSMTYGGAVPTITASYTYGSVVNSATPPSGLTLPTCSTTATSTSPVGPYNSTCTGASDPNYTITYTAGTVTIGPAPLVIAASSGTMIFGGTVPTITASYSGFVNGQGSSVVSGLTCSTTATSTSSVASYTSSCTGATAANYSIAYVNGSVSVTPAPLTITANSVSITAGSALPAFTVSYSGFKNGDSVANLAGTLVCSTTAANTNTAGTFPITCSGQTDPNYTITYVAGTLTITGSVTTGIPIASVSPGCVSFGNVLVGTNCTNQPVTLTNIGTAPLTIASITDSGPQAADFNETTTCGTTLAPGASCTITVSFKPSTVGPETATLIITDNSNGVTGSTQTVGLSGAGVSQIQCNFNGTSISSGNYIWFNSVFSPKNIPSYGSVTYSVTNAQVTFTAGGSNYTVPLPNSIITLSSSVTVATTTFDSANNRWVTLAPLTGLAGNIFLDGGSFPVPATGLPGGIQNVNWQASFATDTAGAGLNWQWGAAVYNNFATDYNQLCVKPVDDTIHCQYQNSDHAGTCEGTNSYHQSWKGCVTGGATGGGGSNCTGSYSGTGSCNPPVGPLTVINCTTFATTAVGSTSTPTAVTIANNSSSTVTGITFSTTGPYAVSSTTCGTSLAAGATCIVYVTFTPTAAGTQTGTLTITDSASNSPQTVNLAGNLTNTVIPIPGPVASVTPTCLAFNGLTQSDCQQWGGQPSAPQTVTLSNTGTGVLNIASVQITGTQASDFSMVNNCGSTLAAGAQCTISVSFNPQTVGPAQASLVITDNSNDINGSTQTVTLVGAGLTELKSSFNENWIPGVNYIWFSGSLTPQNINPNATTNYFMTNGTVTFTENHQNYSVSIPDCIVTFSPNVRTATTSFDTVNNRWITVAPSSGINGNTFLSAVAYQVPNEGLPGSISNIAWTAAFSTDTPGASLNWQWAAAPYDTLPSVTDANNNQSCDYKSCNTKSVDDNHSCQYNDNENAGTPEGWQNHCYAGATCDGVSNHTGNYCNPGGPTCKLGPVYVPTCSTAPPTTCGQTCPPVPITVCNRGSQPINITKVTCTGDFQVCNNVNGTTLQPGQSCTINVSFSPSQKGTRCGTLQVTDNSTNSPHTVCLTGNGQ